MKYVPERIKNNKKKKKNVAAPSFYYMLDSYRVDVQYFFLFGQLTASTVVRQITTHSFGMCAPIRQCPVRTSMRVFTSDFRRLSIVLAWP